jgi:hypothetical protein
MAEIAEDLKHTTVNKIYVYKVGTTVPVTDVKQRLMPGKSVPKQPQTTSENPFIVVAPEKVSRRSSSVYNCHGCTQAKRCFLLVQVN